ncbi:MAG TPA: citrate/2-methylcitrate synthase [Acidimicrobiales bacterium]|nr:citrate/2-methylcitrate synthase [Acidimicrobiales bacterium]
MTRMLESAEAARRLGVKLPTLYAYVSRGLLASHPAPGGRRSLFAAEDVEALAKRSRGGRSTETRLATVTTSATQLRDDGPVYRGSPATGLATTVRYEDAAELIWRGDPTPEDPWEPVRLRPPRALGASDRLRWAVVMAGAGDPLRSDLRPTSVVAVARQLVATMVSVLPGDAGPGPPLELGDQRWVDTVAGALSARLAPAPDGAVVRAVNAALILLADHELATSTVAVRVAASARADLYDALLAGLGVVAGPLHGGASQLAYGLVRDAEQLGPERALDDTLRWQHRLPGFGHSVYRGVDPRFTVLKGLVDDLWPAGRRPVLDALVALAAERAIPGPNVDLGLGALTLATGMPEDAGRTIFTIARVAGWTAHYLEELEERPIRYRARAVYATRR